VSTENQPTTTPEPIGFTAPKPDPAPNLPPGLPMTVIVGEMNDLDGGPSTGTAPVASAPPGGPGAAWSEPTSNYPAVSPRSDVPPFHAELPPFRAETPSFHAETPSFHAETPSFRAEAPSFRAEPETLAGPAAYDLPQRSRLPMVAAVGTAVVSAIVAVAAVMAGAGKKDPTGPLHAEAAAVDAAGGVAPAVVPPGAPSVAPKRSTPSGSSAARTTVPGSSAPAPGRSALPAGPATTTAAKHSATPSASETPISRAGDNITYGSTFAFLAGDSNMVISRSGSAAALAHWDGTAAEKWQMGGSGGAFALKSDVTGLCVTSPSADAGAAVTLTACTGGSDQLWWTVVLVGGDGSFVFKNSAHSLCLKSESATLHAATRIIQGSCDNNSQQQKLWPMRAS
jgi:hypothetical protein